MRSQAFHKNLDGLSSFYLPNMQKKCDGSVALYLGPQPAEELENNWTPTGDKRPTPSVHFGGHQDILTRRIQLFRQPSRGSLHQLGSAEYIEYWDAHASATSNIGSTRRTEAISTSYASYTIVITFSFNLRR